MSVILPSVFIDDLLHQYVVLHLSAAWIVMSLHKELMIEAEVGDNSLLWLIGNFIVFLSVEHKYLLPALLSGQGYRKMHGGV